MTVTLLPTTITPASGNVMSTWVMYHGWEVKSTQSVTGSVNAQIKYTFNTNIQIGVGDSITAGTTDLGALKNFTAENIRGTQN
jgi:hypothetical protein